MYVLIFERDDNNCIFTPFMLGDLDKFSPEEVAKISAAAISGVRLDGQHPLYSMLLYTEEDEDHDPRLVPIEPADVVKLPKIDYVLDFWN